ncbi:hypothetical protein L596_017585 [Steinernema carpocapsae]|uniref:Uncharacterized protein n=1 Tax=Steinernema carpocapsae TaxID=34508 RepID=A0A4U5N2G5_STECR|nr:hypothetical protein L596_017585 [Steinernema carpocapsae]
MNFWQTEGYSAILPQSTESSSESDEDSDASTDDEATGVMDIAIFKDVDGYAAEVENTISTKLPWAFQDFDDKEEPTSEESRKEEST